MRSEVDLGKEKSILTYAPATFVHATRPPSGYSERWGEVFDSSDVGDEASFLEPSCTTSAGAFVTSDSESGFTHDICGWFVDIWS